MRPLLLRLLVSAGEASGEMYGAQLIHAFKRRLPNIEVFGVGGERMQAAGCELVVNARDTSVVGISEIVAHLPRIYLRFRKLLRAVDARQPDAAIVIDSPAFNFRVARQLHRRGVPVFYYVGPQLWAWRPGRIKRVRNYIRKMLVIFPFEEHWYRERGVDAEYVGHPLADVLPRPVARGQYAADNGLDPKKDWIALLPGSRRQEFSLILPEILRAAELLGSRFELLLPLASTLDRGWAKALVRQQSARVRLVANSMEALAHARAAVVASGTATVEAAMMDTPFVMVYRVSPLTWWLGRRLVKVPHLAMVNLIAGAEIVPELVQSDFTAENVATRLKEIIAEGPAREKTLAGLAAVRGQLKPAAGVSTSAAERAADAILRMLEMG